MGLFGKAVRRSVPRSVRKPYRAVRHPVRSAMPRPVKSATRAIYNVTNPVSALGNAAEDAVLGIASTNRSRRKGSSRSRSSSVSGSKRGPSRAGIPSQATLNREQAHSDAEHALHRERELFVLHLFSPSRAKPSDVQLPAPVERDAIKLALEDEYGVSKLRASLAQFGDPPAAPAPTRVPIEPIARTLYEQAIIGIPVWNRAARKQAWALAMQQAAAHADLTFRDSQAYASAVSEWINSSLEELWRRNGTVASLVESRCAAEQAHRQARYDKLTQNAQSDWDLLTANDPVRTRTSVDSALRRRKLDALVMLVDDEGLVVYVQVEQIDDWIEMAEPALTPSGRPTVKKRTKTQRNRLYEAAIASAVLAASRCAISAAPGAQSVTSLVALDTGPNEDDNEIIAVVTFTPKTLDAVIGAGLWTEAPSDLVDALNQADDCVLNTSGRSGDLKPLPMDETSTSLLSLDERLARA